MFAEFKSHFGGDDERRQQEFQQWLDEAEKMLRCITNIDISITVTDPSEDDNPFIGISHGFTTLTGYNAEEILGRDSHFLRQCVPSHLKIQGEREKARKFIHSCEIATLMANCSEPEPEDCCGSLIMQKKDGCLFRNMFLMRFFRIEGKAFVLALQSEVANQASYSDRCWQGLLEMALDRLSSDDVDQDAEPSSEAFENDEEVEVELANAKRAESKEIAADKSTKWTEETRPEKYYASILSEADLEIELQRRERNRDRESANCL